MRALNGLRIGAESTEEREAHQAARRQTVARRIAERQLAHIEEHKYASVVRGGLFGILPTLHDTDVYEQVAQRLLGDEIEVNVHSISQSVAKDGVRIDNFRLVEVVSVLTIQGQPRYLPEDPTTDPEIFAREANTIGRCGAYSVAQVYPPDASVEPILVA
jgi:hypothetical protein